jgi:ubiquinone/menaquinone biosynthesis C-methylase UbiE
VTQEGALGDGARTARQYDAMAGPYSDYNEVNAANGHYERPATMAALSAIGLDGKRVLEIGCGSGRLTEWMIEAGAEVTAFDVSSEMVKLATERIGDRARILRHDLHQPLSFVSDASFDVVVASLVFHYLRDWRAIMAELRRVLVPGGRVVFTTHHPSWDWLNHTPDDYFAVMQVTESWERAGKDYDVTFWRRPLRGLTSPITEAGLVIEQLTEPEPLPELAERDPEAYAELTKRPFFLLFVLRAPGGGGL